MASSTSSRSRRTWRFWLLYIPLFAGTIMLAFLLPTASPEALWIRVGAGGVIAILFVALGAYVTRQRHLVSKIELGTQLLCEQDFSVRLARVGIPEVDAAVDLFNALIQRLRDERLRLNEQGLFLQKLIDSSPLAIVLMDFDYRITSLNESALHLLGIPRQRIPCGVHILSPEVGFPFQLTMGSSGQSTVVRSGTSNVYRYTWSSFQDQGFPRPFLTVEVLTDEMFQAERQAYSQFIRICAHEVNNAAGSIDSILDLTGQHLASLPGSQPYREAVDSARTRMANLSHFIARVASLVKIPSPSPAPTDVAQQLHRIASEFGLLCADTGVEIEARIPAQAPLVRLDPILMHQVLENIVQNAVQSLEHGGHVRLLFVDEHGWQIVVEDDGLPIPPELETQLFAPFFSTKPQGQGLGLLLCREVLREHGFSFRLSTEADGLTRFRIYIPPMALC